MKRLMTIPEPVLPGRSDPIGWSCVLAAAVLAWALAIPPASASNNDNKDTQTETQQKDKGGQRPSSNDKSADKSPNEFASCKRDADGMKGPERSRFMTTCLKERK
jgi:hypothetical protein